MAEGLLGRKRGMTQVFTEKGEVVPVTVIEAGPCFVSQIKTAERDGYSALQLGFEEVRRVNKPERGHLKQLPGLRILREVRPTKGQEYRIGDKLTVSLFAVGDIVDVTGISKGKGFAGVVKRHHFAGQPKTHGASDRTRAPGSSGATTTPGRVLKGTRRSGHMGDVQVTVQNLKVIVVDPERNLMAVHGAIPGAKNGLVLIRRARKE